MSAPMQGYLTRLKGLFVTALRETFDGQYPSEDFRNLHVSIEYPLEKANYPGIWVDYEDGEPLVIAGIDHTEYLADADGGLHLVTRWRFSGFMSFTVTALTSLERDRLYDEVVSTIAFARQDPVRGRLKATVEQNDYLAVNMQFDSVTARGNTATPGTPWDTDEMIYEVTVTVEVIGEFVPALDPDDVEGLALLSEVIVRGEPVLPGEAAPEPVDYPDDVTAGNAFAAWH